MNRRIEFASTDLDEAVQDLDPAEWTLWGDVAVQDGFMVLSTSIQALLGHSEVVSFEVRYEDGTSLAFRVSP